MAFPVAKVEIAFTDGPYVVSPTWTDVSAYCYEMTIDRGREDDWTTFQGTASVVLNNRTRRFDPYYTSGPYYGNLLPRRQIRISSVYNGTTTVQFRGFIDGWPPAWTDAGTNSTVTLSCFDALQLLSQQQLPADWARAYILGLNPYHYWNCDDPINPYSTGVVTDYGQAPRNLPVTTNAVQGNQLAVGLPNRSVSGPNAILQDTYNTSLQTSPVASDWTISFWSQPYSGEYMTINTQWAGKSINIFANGNQSLTVWVNNYGGGQQWVNTTLIGLGYEPHHVMLTWNNATSAIKWYIDGIDQTGTTTTNFSGIAPYSNDYWTVSGTNIQQLCAWTVLLTQPYAQNIYQLSTALFAESTSTREGRIVNQTPFPGALTSFTGSAVGSVLDITDDAPYATPEMHLVAQSEGSPLFVTKSGMITLMGRYEQFSRANGFTSQSTYGSGGVGMGEDVTISPGGDSMRNVINVSASAGQVYTTTYAASQTAYGSAAQSWDTETYVTTDTKQLGNMLAGFGAQVYPQLSELEIGVTSDADWSKPLALEFYDRITVNVAPPTGNTITLSPYVQRIRHTAVPGRWQTFVGTSVRWGSAFRIGTSYINGPDVIVYS
jgi:hypothetical protein